MTNIIKELPAESGHVGYTDFTAIYVNQNLIEEEKELVRIHELSHIWLGHNLRYQAFKKSRKTTDHILANIAMDMEIAKHIYDSGDEKIFARRNSLLSGSITKKHCEKYPNCQYFEEYYIELEKEAEQSMESWDAAKNSFDDNKSDSSAKKASQAVKEAKEKSKELKKHNNTQKAQAKLEGYKLKPSLASEIDSIAGRQKLKRESSYRRPSRIEHPDFFKKGKISKRKTPKITVYVDRSGSFDAAKTSEATKALKQIMIKYRGQVDNDTLYFNDKIYTKDPVEGSGGTNHQLVIDEILRSKSELSIIITDDDYGVTHVPEKLPRTIVIPIGCYQTEIAKKLSLRECNL